MATWMDFFSLIATLSFIGGTAHGLLVLAHQCHLALESIKESLQSKGVSVSEHGISVKLSRRLDPEDCMDVLVELLHHNAPRRRASDAHPVLPPRTSVHPSQH
ncbi:hypothetical protein OBBRIDRAFT_177601 [Obba rivulosa]|uniref:Uncharacterized protein n=1 Tax=Obba rivulosa TaxID=1052685 RepID=A0A8E2ASD2_9APHY|nr:hypothetical protein OBBRIDRAFT_177601 [Obba rivulosa]